MKKVLFILNHCSTGGMPQYAYSLMSKIINEVDVYCIEYSFIAPHYIVQREKIQKLLNDKFYSLSENKNELFSIIESISPDVIHMQEMPEYFMDNDVASKLYSNDRKYKIIETSHDSSFTANQKRFKPDHFALISKFQINEFEKLGIPIDLIEMDIEYKDRPNRNEELKKLGLDPSIKHVLNVGLFTSRKNQAEIIEYARQIESYPVQFHFIGNMADNFRSYWEPLLVDLPKNVKIWGERSDVDTFYSCMDLFLFTSRGTEFDKETSPLVIREAIGWNIPTLIYNLPVYLGMYNEFKIVKYLDFNNLQLNLELILSLLNLNKEISNKTNSSFISTLDGYKDLSSLSYSNSMVDVIAQYGDAAGMYWGSFIYKELERDELKINKGDVFVDLGANIGISSLYATKCGASKIYCFEPDPVLITHLKHNVPSSTIFNVSISSSRGEIELYNWPYNHINEGPKYSTNAITLVDVIDSINENIIDYLKVDIEGFEEHLFDDVPISYLKRIKQIFIEHHYPDTTERLAGKLRARGFHVTIENGNGQNYLYCKNFNLSLYAKNGFEVQYDNTSNKITYSSDRSISNFLISVRDIDSRAVIWSVKYDNLPANTNFWMMPLHKDFLDFETNENFGGMIVELYENNFLLYSKNIRIKDIGFKKHIVSIDNNSEPIFINYNEFFVDGIYNKYINENDKFDVVVDVGANVGVWCEYILPHLNNSKQLYALEPNKIAFDILNNSFSDRINVVNKALCPNDGSLEFYTTDNNSTVSSISNYGRPFNKSYLVSGISFKSFINEYKLDKIDLMKIDIESGEYDLFDSMTDSDFNIIDKLLIEYHLFADITFEGNVMPTLVNRLLRLNYDVSIEQVHSTGGFIFATRKNVYNNIQRKKIKAIHLLINDDMQKQQNSIENVSKIEQIGINYKQIFNDKYTDIPPKNRSKRPNNVVERNNSTDICNPPGSLTPAHYGCYESFKLAVLSEFDTDVDYLMIFEGDAQILNHESFYNILNESLSVIDQNDIGYLSFGGRYEIEFGNLQSNCRQNLNNDIILTDKIIGCQCIVFSAKYRDILKHILLTERWDALDIYLNEVINKYKIKMAVTDKIIVSQYDGPSLLDGTYKIFQKYSL